MSAQAPRGYEVVRSQLLVLAMLAVEMVFVVFLIVGAVRADAEWRPWYLVAAGGLSLMVGAIAWSRFRRSGSFR